MKRRLLLALALALSAVTLCARAQNVYPPQPTPALIGPYVGALFGRSQAKQGCVGVISGGGRACDETDLAYGAFGGYQFHRYYGVELGFNNLGKVRANNRGPGTASSQNVQAYAWDLSGIAWLPFDQNLSAFARLGGYRATLSTSEPGVAERSNTGWAYGGGLQWDLNRQYGLRALWQRYRNIGSQVYGKNTYDVLGVSAYYRFR